MPLSITTVYEQASECCRNYTKLTMQVRTLAQQMIIGYAVGMGIFLSRSAWPPKLLNGVLLGAGVLLILFAAGLWILNQHHSLAFEAMRDRCLVPLENDFKSPLKDESGNKILGPWEAHAECRVKILKSGKRKHLWKTWFGWHLPYIILIFIGVLSIFTAIIWHPVG